jgi:hypothetical protein
LRKVIWAICFSLLLTGCIQHNNSIREQTHEQKEYIHYNIVTNDNEQGALIKTQEQNIELNLKIEAHISRPKPVLYTIFLNGKQIKVQWDKNKEPSYLLRMTLLPDENVSVKFRICDLPKGTNTLNFGSVSYPDKYDIPEKEQLSANYSMNLHPFTIIVGNEGDKSTPNFTSNNKEIVVNKADSYNAPIS